MEKERGEKLKQNFKKDQKSKQKPIPTVSYRSGKEIVEMLYDEKSRSTVFAHWDGSAWELKKLFQADNKINHIPYSPTNPLVGRHIVYFPSQPAEYESTKQLLADIRTYVHRYVDVSESFEKIASYYVLLTWVFDAFNEVPYLRLRGDYGAGKTRFLLIVGSICYKGFLSSGASTVAPIFHLLNNIGGTLALDEGDLRFSDEKTDMVKILNNGTVRNVPVLRCEKINNFEFAPKAYDVFTPKIVATRGYYNDQALESRFISEEMGLRKIRKDIPHILPDTYKEEALALRNKLLMYRFRNLNSVGTHIPESHNDITGRLNQMFLPLLSVVEDQQDRLAILDIAKEYDKRMQVERSESAAGKVCALIAKHTSDNPDAPLTIKKLLYAFIEEHAMEHDRRITAKWIGFIVRKKLHFTTRKSNGNFVIDINPEHLKNLCEIYDITE